MALEDFKAAIIAIFIITVCQIIMWKQYDSMKGVARSDEPTENYNSNLQFPFASQNFIVSFRSLFSCRLTTLLLWLILSAVIVS